MTEPVTTGVLEALSALHDASDENAPEHALVHALALQVFGHDTDTAEQHRRMAVYRPGWGSRGGRPGPDPREQQRACTRDA